MNNYFEELYNDVYEYTYDIIMENETTSNRGGDKKNINPKIKKKIKHKKRKLLLLITAMIGAFVLLYKRLSPDYMEDWSQEEYDEIKRQINSGSYKQDKSVYNRIKTKYNVTDNSITRDYCKEMIKKLKKDKEKINELDDFKSMKALLDIEKRMKNPIAKLVDSKYLTPGMKRKIGNAWSALHFEDGFIDEDFFEEE